MLGALDCYRVVLLVMHWWVWQGYLWLNRTQWKRTHYTSCLFWNGVPVVLSVLSCFSWCLRMEIWNLTRVRQSSKFGSDAWRSGDLCPALAFALNGLGSMLEMRYVTNTMDWIINDVADRCYGLMLSSSGSLLQICSFGEACAAGSRLKRAQG